MIVLYEGRAHVKNGKNTPTGKRAGDYRSIEPFSIKLRHYFRLFLNFFYIELSFGIARRQRGDFFLSLECLCI